MKLARRFLHLVTGDQAAREAFSAILTPSTATGGADCERWTGWPAAVAAATSNSSTLCSSSSSRSSMAMRGGRWATGSSHYRPPHARDRAGSVAAAVQRGVVDPVPLQPAPR